jgi:hypothetical protein
MAGERHAMCESAFRDSCLSSHEQGMSPPALYFHPLHDQEENGMFIQTVTILTKTNENTLL